jgi:hypothetical protein
MAIQKEEAVTAARKDLARRLGAEADEITATVTDAEFPDMALGAGTRGEMSGQMITPGWRILLKVGSKSYEYRANKSQIRLYKYQGRNYRI